MQTMLSRLLLPLLLLIAVPVGAESYEKLSPFDMLRFEGEEPQVRMGEKWFEPVEISGVPVAEILSFCRGRYGDRWSKRFGEDLVQVLSEMNHPPPPRVSLLLRELDGGELHRLEQVAMTRTKREAIRNALSGSPPAAPRLTPRRVSREHRSRSPRYEGLSRRYSWLSAEQVAEDLDQLEWHLENQFSYLRLRGVDYREALDTIRAAAGAGINRAGFHIQLRKLLALFGDGHSRTQGISDALPGGFLPIAVADSGGRLVALEEEGNLVDPEHPYLMAIDGLPTERWLAEAAPLIAQGSEQLIRFGAIRRLAWVQYLRQGLNRRELPVTELTLASPEGSITTVTRPVANKPLFHQTERETQAKMLPDGIAYLPIPSMTTEPADIEAIHQAMGRFREARALVVDVRGNGGGSRDALRALLPYFLAEDAPPFIANVAAYRLPAGTQSNPEGHLANRGLYPLSSQHWTGKERQALASFAASFRPEWPLPEGFSDWHYFVIRREGPAGLYFFNRPVAVLQDEGCFSATDIFLGAFSELPRVTLVGLPSGGGSGRSKRILLHHSSLQIRLSSMASFRPDGHLYEGRGIHPDLRVGRTLDDVLGNTDTALQRALEVLRDGSRDLGK